MDTITIKTSELIGPALDWAVAKCEDAGTYIKDGMLLISGVTWGYYEPSTNWGQGGPIIERIKGLEFKHWLESPPESRCEAHIHNYEGDWVEFGPTPLIAAMRCYVASKLGDTVQIPKGLAP